MGLDDINVLEKFLKKCSTMSTIFNTVTFFKYWLQAHLQRIQSISNIFRVFRCFKIDFPNPKPNNPHNKYEQFWVHLNVQMLNVAGEAKISLIILLFYVEYFNILCSLHSQLFDKYLCQIWVAFFEFCIQCEETG